MRYARIKCLCWKEVTNTSFMKVDGELFRTKEVQQGNVVYEIECSIGEGLPGLCLIGMKEHETIMTKEIIRAAIKKQGFTVPKARIVVSIRLIDDPKNTLSAEVIGPSLLSPDRKVASAIAMVFCVNEAISCSASVESSIVTRSSRKSLTWKSASPMTTVVLRSHASISLKVTKACASSIQIW